MNNQSIKKSINKKINQSTKLIGRLMKAEMKPMIV